MSMESVEPNKRTKRRLAADKRSRESDLPLLRLSMPWLIGCVLLTVGYAAWLMLASSRHPGDPAGHSSHLIQSAAAAAYVLLLLATVFAWLLCVRRSVNRLLQEAHEVVEGVILGESRRLGYTESELSLLEHKLTRFAEGLREREDEAGREKAVIQRLIADISHQTKTPLANMLLYAELLEERPEADPTARAWIGQVKTQADKLHFLIRSLVDMSRLETGVLTMNPGFYPLEDAVTAAIAQASASAEAAGICLAVERCGKEADAPFMALYDPKWTAEALFNLLDNAIKYGHAGGRAVISLSRGEVYACIEVADDGPGIAEEERAEIFGRFRRGKEAGLTEGLGLGLYLAREIVQHQEGRIQVGTSIWGGASFRIFLPIESWKGSGSPEIQAGI